MLKKIVIKIKVVNNLITVGRGLLIVSLSALPLALLWWGNTDTLSQLFVWISCGLLLYTIIASSPDNLSKWWLPMSIIALVVYAPILLFIWHNAFSSFDGFAYFFCFNSIPYYCVWLLKYYYIRRLRHDQSADLESPIQQPPDDQKIMTKVVNKLITLGRGLLSVSLSTLPLALLWWGVTDPLSWLFVGILCGFLLYTVITSSPYNLSKWLLPMDIIAPVAFAPMLLFIWHNVFSSFDGFVYFFCFNSIPYYCIWLLKYSYIRRLRHDQSSDLESPIQPPPDDQKIMIEVVNTLITVGRGWFGFHLTTLHFSLLFVGNTKQSSWLHAWILFMLFLYIIITSSPDNLSKWLLPMDIIAPVAMGVVYITMLLMDFMGHSPSYAMSIFFPAVIIPYYCIWLLKYYYIRRLRHDQSSDLESPI